MGGRYLITFNIEEGEQELRKLGRLLYESAGQFYLDAARRRLSLHAERRSQTPELNARVAFKVCLALPIQNPFPSTLIAPEPPSFQGFCSFWNLKNPTIPVYDEPATCLLRRAQWMYGIVALYT